MGGGGEGAPRRGLQGLQKGQAVGLHLHSQGLLLPFAGYGPLQAAVKIVALPGPVEHHQPVRKLTVAQQALQTMAVGGAGEGLGQGVALVQSSTGIQLAQHHPGGGLHRLLAEPWLLLQARRGRGTGFLPTLLRFPPPTEGNPGHRQQIPQVGAVNHNLGPDTQGLGATAHLQGLDAVTTPLHRFQLHPPQHPQPCMFRRQPALQQRLGPVRSPTKTTHPAVIQTPGLRRAHPPQKRSPKTRLPGTEFMAVPGADPGSAHHAATPGAGQQEDGVGAGSGRLESGAGAPQAPTPHHHVTGALLHGVTDA